MSMISGLHHIELCVENGLKTLANFTSTYGFRLVGKRETINCKQWVVNSGLQKKIFPAFVITERRNAQRLRSASDQFDTPDNDWTTFCCENNFHKRDSVFNIALEINNVEECTQRSLSNGARLISEPRVIRDKNGQVQYSIISSQCGNIIHTLINRKLYPSNLFLPSYDSVQDVKDRHFSQNHFNIEGIDHVTYVCKQGQSKDLVNWYSKVFGMQRLFMNNNESEEDGVVIDYRVGLRLKAMKYWLCAESGVKASILNNTNDPENQANSFKLVFAEPLHENENSHVELFLKEHNGPGIQHIGLSSSNIIKTVTKMNDAGVSFQYPPRCYYSQPEKAAEIEACGESANELEKYGILLDNEADCDSLASEDCKYLLQIFAKPIFRQETFFFEVIQRKGANGFGAGNILALIKSIEQEHLQQQS